MWIIHMNSALGLTLWWSAKVANQLNLNQSGPAFCRVNQANIQCTMERIFIKVMESCLVHDY